MRLKHLKKQTAVLEQKSKDAENRSIEISREYSAFEAQLLGSRADLSNLRQDLVRLEAEKRACDNELANAGASVENSMNEITNCRRRIETLEKDKNSAKQLLVELNKKIFAAEEKVNELTGSRAELTKKREEISLQLQNLRLEIVSSQKDIDALNSDIVFAKSTGNENLERKAELNQEIERIKSVILEKTEFINSTNAEIEKLIANQNERSKAIEKINADREQLEKRSAEIRTIERDKTSERETSGRELARLEERKINIQKQYDDIISKLWEEYELTRREAEDCAVEIDDSKQAQRRLNELKQKIRSLGNVNVSAIEEYKEVSERYEFMSAQVMMLKSQRKRLKSLLLTSQSR